MKQRLPGGTTRTDLSSPDSLPSEELQAIAAAVEEERDRRKWRSRVYFLLAALVVLSGSLATVFLLAVLLEGNAEPNFIIATGLATALFALLTLTLVRLVSPGQQESDQTHPWIDLVREVGANVVEAIKARAGR